MMKMRVMMIKIRRESLRMKSIATKLSIFSVVNISHDLVFMSWIIVFFMVVMAVGSYRLGEHSASFVQFSYAL